MQILMQGSRTGFDFETVPVDATSGGVALSASKYTHDTSTSDKLSSISNTQKASGATITVELADIRAVFSPGQAVAPVGGATGLLFSAGSSFDITGWSNLRDVRFIRDGGTTAKIQVQYWE